MTVKGLSLCCWSGEVAPSVTDYAETHYVKLIGRPLAFVTGAFSPAPGRPVTYCERPTSVRWLVPIKQFFWLALVFRSREG